MPNLRPPPNNVTHQPPRELAPMPEEHLRGGPRPLNLNIRKIVPGAVLHDLSS